MDNFNNRNRKYQIIGYVFDGETYCRNCCPVADTLENGDNVAPILDISVNKEAPPHCAYCKDAITPDLVCSL